MPTAKFLSSFCTKYMLRKPSSTPSHLVNVQALALLLDKDFGFSWLRRPRVAMGELMVVSHLLSEPYRLLQVWGETQRSQW